MPRYYRVKLPKRIASQWAKPHTSVAADDPFAVHEDRGVTFRVSDLRDGKVPAESTVDDGFGPQSQRDVGLSEAEAADVIRAMAVAERASQPDRLPVVVALVCAALVAILATGLVQSAVAGAREHLIEERIKRPRAQYGWSARVGATREKLGLPKNAPRVDYERPVPRFFPSVR